MPAITDNVSFDTVAREWRAKWSADADKASLTAAQSLLEGALMELKALPGLKSVQRIVCGSCMDFKVIVALEADKFGDWEGKEFAPEKDFLAKLGAIEGISQVETQTYTLMSL